MTTSPQRIYKAPKGKTPDDLLNREWLVTNGLGGYASSTIAGVNTWRYHGMLISAEAGKLGRILVVKDLSEQLRFANNRVISLTGSEIEAGNLEIPAVDHLREFRLNDGIPTWRFEVDGVEIERTILMPHRQNSVYVTYKVIKAPEPVQLELRPYVYFRPQESGYDPQIKLPFTLRMEDNRYEVSAGGDLPILRMSLQSERSFFVTEGGVHQKAFFRKDAERGYDPQNTLWTPGFFHVKIMPGEELTLVLSTEDWANIDSLKPSEAMSFEKERRCRLLERAGAASADDFASELVLAADQFLFEPKGRLRQKIQALATDDNMRAVIAGYHWFTDWGRDTMISLEGLTLSTGRFSDARGILRTLNRYVKNGLIPNFIPEGADDGVYHTVDATLWYFHALDRYLAYTDDRTTLRLLLPTLKSIADHHIKGTRYGIRVDESDNLLTQGEEGYQLTWMDAKVDGWVVTPRRGKAVEVNSLWYNALRLLSQWIAEEEGEELAQPYTSQADKLRASFNDKFWFAEGGYLYDVIDGEQGNDSACRPNQLISFSLRYPVLDKSKWESVLQVSKDKLLTPVGLRSLSPDHPDYKPYYFGDLRSRDAAYHQGTVWPWLIGPFIDAWLAQYPQDRKTARGFLEGFIPHLDEACIGSISEIYDATAPYTPRGCISQAWSVGEVLRCWIKTGDQSR